MTADWKKKPLERTQQRDSLKAANATIRALQQQIAALKSDLKWTRLIVEQEQKRAERAGTEQSNYRYLRDMGVMIEDEGQFKYLKGEELDAYFTSMKIEVWSTYPGTGTIDSKFVDAAVYSMSILKVLGK